MKQFKYIALAVVFLSAFGLNAQQRLEKLSKTVNANKDVTLNLDTNYTNIEIDTWDKNQIKVEAYVESKKLSKDELKEILDSWEVDVEGSGSNVSIETSGGIGSKFNFNFDFSELEILKDINIDLGDMPEIPIMPEMNIIIPELPVMPEMDIKIPKMPDFPKLPKLPGGVHNVNFDFEAYKKDGEAYLEKWSQKYEDLYGKEYKTKMKEWGREFGKTDFDEYSKKMEDWGEKFGEKFGKDYEVKMEKWSKEFSEKFDKDWAKKWEEWGKKFEEKYDKEWEAKIEKKYGKDWEERVEERAKKMEDHYEKLADDIEKRFEKYENGDIIKTIKIKMPKDTKLKVNVRHGELKFASVIHNLKADLSHSSLLATNIDGSKTSISASYTPVLVDNWLAGELKLNYVENAVLKKVKHLMLTSNSSNIAVGELGGNAMINGSFGDLEINSITNAFNNLNLVLENSDAVVSLPKTDYNLQFQGKRTRLQHPEKSGSDVVSTFSTGNLSSNKTIVVNAKYSNVVMQ